MQNQYPEGKRFAEILGGCLMIEMSMLTYIRTKILSPFPNNSLKCRHLQALKNDFGENKSAPDLLAAVSRPAIQHHLMYLPRPVWAWSARAAAKSRTGSKAISDHSEDLMSRLDSLKQMGCFSTLNSTLVSGQERPYPKAFKTASFRTQSLKKVAIFSGPGRV